MAEKVTECRSLQDLRLKYKYSDDKFKATFTHVVKRLDRTKCIQSIKAFQKKVNSHSKETGYKLLYGRNTNDCPYLVPKTMLIFQC